MTVSPEVVAMVGLGFLTLGTLAQLVGGIWLIILGFRKSVMWGLGVWFVPFVSLIFGIMFWDEAQEAMIVSILGLVFMAVAVLYFQAIGSSPL